MNQFLDDLSPRAPPNPSHSNDGMILLPSVPDVSILFEQNRSNTDHKPHQNTFNHTNNRFQSVPQIFSNQIFGIANSTTFNRSPVTVSSPVLPPIIPVATTTPHRELQSNANNQDDLNRLRHNELMQLLGKTATDLEALRSDKETTAKMNDLIIQELRECKATITALVTKQNDLELALEEINSKQIAPPVQIITKCDKETMTDEVIEPPVRPRAISVPGRPPRFVLSPSENVFSPVGSPAPITSNGDGGGDLKQLFNKYEVAGTITTRRSVDFSVSSLNYLQRYGLMDDTKLK